LLWFCINVALNNALGDWLKKKHLRHLVSQSEVTVNRLDTFSRASRWLPETYQFPSNLCFFSGVSGSFVIGRSDNLLFFLFCFVFFLFLIIISFLFFGELLR